MSTIPFPASTVCIYAAHRAMQHCSVLVVDFQNLLLLDSTMQIVARARVHIYAPGSMQHAVFKHSSPRQFQSGEFSGDGGTGGTSPPCFPTLFACKLLLIFLCFLLVYCMCWYILYICSSTGALLAEGCTHVMAV